MSAGSIIRRLRKEQGLTQEELADRSGIRQASISAYECGLYEPMLKSFEAVLNGLGYELTVRKMRARAEEDKTV